LTAVDTSVVVSAFASWHEHHDVAVDALGNGPRLPGHCALEALSVLTRLPPPFRAPGPLVTEFLEVSFRDPPLVLAAEQFAALVQRLPGLGISGGAVHDALVGATSAAAGRELLTLDARATSTYQRVGVEARLLL